MKKEDKLVRLIKGLDQGERRVFKNHLKNTTGDKQYELLYELILKYGANYTAYLSNKKRGKYYIANLSTTKRYLYLLILDVLAKYQRTKSERGKIEIELDRIQVLVTKGFFEEAQTTINRAKSAC